MMNAAIENLVIGGGPAGTMVAICLAETGRKVTLVERERGPHHKVCGEFLSREAIQYLEPIGIDLRGLGAAPIHSVRVHGGNKTAEAPLPFRAMSLSRRTLDEAMLAQARRRACEVRRGVEVETLTREEGLWRVSVRESESIWARNVFLATGKHDVRGWARSKGEQSDLVGFKMHWRLGPVQTEALRGVMELFLFPGGYGGISLVEGDAVTLCFVVRRSRLQRLGGWAGVVEEIKRASLCVKERLEGACALYEKPLAISPIPYGYLSRRDCGVWCVGDQAAVIPSFTGDGMSIALHSAATAAQMYLEGRSIAEFNRTLDAQLKSEMRLAMMLSRTMVTGPGQRLAPFALALVPQGLRWIAAATRIPESSMVAGRPQREVSPA